MSELLEKPELPVFQAKYFYWAKIILKLGSSILEPLMLNLNLKKQNQVNDEQRRIMVTQQAIRQGVTFFTDNICFIGSGLLANRVLRKLPNAQLLGLISGMVGEEIIGNLLFRPYLMSKVTAWWENRLKVQGKGQLAAGKSGEIKAPVLSSSPARIMPPRVYQNFQAARIG